MADAAIVFIKIRRVIFQYPEYDLDDRISFSSRYNALNHVRISRQTHDCGIQLCRNIFSNRILLSNCPNTVNAEK